MASLIRRQILATTALLFVHILFLYFAIGAFRTRFAGSDVLTGFAMAGVGVAVLGALLLKWLGWSLDTLFAVLLPLFAIMVMGGLMIADGVDDGRIGAGVLLFWFNGSGIVVTIGLWRLYLTLRPEMVSAKKILYSAFTIQYIAVGLFVLMEPHTYYFLQAFHWFLFHNVSFRVIF